MTNQLLQNIYSSEHSGFYLTNDKDFMSDEIFLWVCDMAKNDDMQVTILCEEPVELGSLSEKKVNISVLLSNIVLDYFGPDIAVQFISDDGTFNLYWSPMKGYYQGDVVIYNKIENIPLLYGVIEVTKGDIISFDVAIRTNSDLFDNQSKIKELSASNDDSSNGKIVGSSVQNALPIMIILIALPSVVIFFSSKSRRKSKIGAGFK
jgi:hypothetical protein